MIDVGTPTLICNLVFYQKEMHKISQVESQFIHCDFLHNFSRKCLKKLAKAWQQRIITCHVFRLEIRSSPGS